MDEKGEVIEHALCVARPDVYHLEHTLQLE